MDILGNFNIKVRPSSNRLYVNISIPPEAVEAAGVKPGEGYRIEIKPKSLTIHRDMGSLTKFPKLVGKRSPIHTLECSPKSLGLQSTKPNQFEIPISIGTGSLELHMPEEIELSKPIPKVRRVTRDPELDLRLEKAAKLRWKLGSNPSANVAVEAVRINEPFRPTNLEDMIAGLRSAGVDLDRYGPGLFSINGRMSNLADLQDEFNEINKTTKGDTTVLVLD